MLSSYIPYTLGVIDNSPTVYRDIFAFRNTFTELAQNGNIVLRYQMKDGDTPCSISNLLYGSERYEWIIYCLNSIVNPYYDLPLSEEDLYEMMESKYFDKQCLFLEMDSFTNNFTVGETITQGTTTGIVHDWNRTLCKITVKNVSGSFDTGAITSPSSSGIIGRIVEKAEEALHHFESFTGAKLDPYAGFLQQYISGTDDQYAITNKENEIKINDSKRNIYVVKPEYVQNIEANLVKNLNQIATFDAKNILS